MLIRITNSCRMGCKYCMVNATENNEHISIKNI